MTVIPQRNTLIFSAAIVGTLLFIRGSLILPENSGPWQIVTTVHAATQTKQPSGRRLPSIPHPELSQFEPAVQQQIREVQAKLSLITQTAEAPDSQLSDAYGEMGKIYHAYDLLEAAKACYLNANILAPQDYHWHYYLARLCNEEGNLSEAIERYKIILQVRPNDIVTLIRLGDAYLDQSRPDLAQPLFEKAISLDASCSAALAGIGKVALATRDYGKAIKYLESCLKIDPKASSIHYSLAMAYRETGELEKAQTHLVNRGPQKPQLSDPLMEELRDLTTGQRILWIKGSQALRERRLTEAVDFFRKMVAGGSHDPLARLYLGTALSLLHDSQGAIEQYTEGLRLAPSNAKLHYNMAILLIELRSEQEAIEHLKATVRLDPGMKDGYFHLGNELMRAGRFEEALPNYTKVIELEPGNGFARLMQAMTLVRLRSYEKAKDVLEKGHLVLPNNTDITHALARLLATCPNSTIRSGSTALQLIQSLPAKNLDLDQAETLAMALAEVGQFSRAIELQQRLITEVKNANRDDLEHLLAENLKRYQSGKPCRIPWRDDDPIFAPTPENLAPLDPSNEETSSTGKDTVLSNSSR